jgi:hypothetical protein
MNQDNCNKIKHTEGGEGITTFRTFQHAGINYTPTGYAEMDYSLDGPWLKIKLEAKR